MGGCMQSWWPVTRKSSRVRMRPPGCWWSRYRGCALAPARGWVYQQDPGGVPGEGSREAGGNEGELVPGREWWSGKVPHGFPFFFLHGVWPPFCFVVGERVVCD